ncbi:MAG: hypothetical protein A2X61_11135 [Ignavibacteria bacterium GWB2_35_12]|nr:MAG: hypothetical protein A2X63_09865 [Ignavibacteria bacterium GWA2_35_8]OGU39591.1 MAG: hypothetical protein A2X61_11135 [Ignavibacteria bacterium GWB2_35_12]OGU86626.1 MAG: hypothetical protein A2220_02540 [Ignavibacteria bacterium RIFOXYA2_FULL_35_10]OGV23992.1 MAG: hypothetical protein A2475_10780 [Ignavibacteria bacterium RIFOXYC2_FULL_35_21]
MNSEIIKSIDYLELLQEVKSKIRNAQIKAVVRVNSELILLYWELGRMIIEKQSFTNWGDGLIEQLSRDLSNEFPDLKGFSLTNLYTIQRWYNYYSNNKAKVQQVVAEFIKKSSFTKLQQVVAEFEVNSKSNHNNDLNIFSNNIKIQQHVRQIEISKLLSLIPWGHNIEIIHKCKDIDSALFYVAITIENNWSRSVLVHQIETKLFERQGKIISNFELTLPKPQSDLALQTLKDPYIFDFLSMKDKADEKDIEEQLTSHITKFLLELGTGFAYLGRQYHLEVSGKDYYLDLLFYHLKLRCFIIIELKAVDFKPEFAGKLNFYLSVVDDLLKNENDNSSIGLILCKTKDKITAEYALRGMSQPIGVAEYQLVKAIPDNLKSSLPSIEEIEMELMKYE